MRGGALGRTGMLAGPGGTTRRGARGAGAATAAGPGWRDFGVRVPPHWSLILGVGMLGPGVTEGRRDAAARALWLAAVHQVSRAVGAVAEPAVGRNYYRAVVGDGTVVLLNAAAMVVGAAGRGSDEMALRFVDVPGGEVFERYGFSVLGAAEAERAVDARELAALGADERRDVDYHGAQRVGDVLFNWFD